MIHEAPHAKATGIGMRAFAEQKRAEKRAAAENIGVDTDYIDHLVDAFYARIREDSLLGPIFAQRIADWPSHLTRMKAFWRSVLHNSGEFSGNPMLKHLAIPDLELRHFARWLGLFTRLCGMPKASTRQLNSSVLGQG